MTKSSAPGPVPAPGPSIPLWNSAPGLLAITGALLGASLPLGKLAVAQGVSSMMWAVVISLGAGGMLMLVLLARGRLPRLTRPLLRFSLVAGIVSYAVPNLLMFVVIPHVGAGYGGLMYTLSPIITLALATLLKLNRPTPLGLAGIAVGFVGALTVAATRGEAGQPAELLWVGLALLIPVFLAAGNIYRTIGWPAGAGPTELAASSQLAAAVLLIALALATGQAGDFAALAGVPGLVVAQVAASALMFGFFFRLQEVGGPVYLSQTGYVAAAVGLGSGTLFLGESYGLLTWAGAAIITVGVVLASIAQTRQG